MISKIFIAILLLGLVGLFIIFPIWAIIDCINSDQRDNKAKAWWVVLMVFTWWVGALIYWIATMGKRRG